VISVHSEEEWHAFCQVLGHPHWAKEEKFSNLLKRIEHADELDQQLGQWTEQHTPEEVVELLQKVGVPAGVVQDAEDLAKILLKAEYFIAGTSLWHDMIDLP
jgi:crotonobetainyl-CoA:carnitine CoA-transferase CaiB-like acyl-CoA transferase